MHRSHLVVLLSIYGFLFVSVRSGCSIPYMHFWCIYIGRRLKSLNAFTFSTDTQCTSTSTQLSKYTFIHKSSPHKLVFVVVSLLHWMCMLNFSSQFYSLHHQKFQSMSKMSSLYTVHCISIIWGILYALCWLSVLLLHSSGIPIQKCSCVHRMEWHSYTII